MGIYRTNDPTQFDDIDGIVIDESAPPSAISGAAANVAILVGQFQRGPLELSLPLGSIGDFHEVYGKSLLSGNKQLKNKKFGALRIIRAAAADAIKATLTVDAKLKFDAKSVGAYGNNIQVTVGDVTGDIASVPAVAQEEKWDFVGQTGNDYDVVGAAKKLNLASGLAYVWFNVTDGANTQTDPGGTGTAIEVQILDADTAIDIASTAKDAINTASVAGVGTATDDAVSAMEVPYTVGLQSAPGDAGDTGTTFSITATGAALVPSVNAGFKVTIEDLNPDAVLPVEIYDGLTAAGLSASTFAGSRLVDVTILSQASDPANQVATPLATGSDGTLVDTDYEAAIVLAEEEKAGNVIFLDQYNATRNGYLKSHVSSTQDKMCIVCGQAGDNKAAAVADAANYRDADGRVIYAWPYVQTSINGVLELTAPAAWVASIFSQTSPHVALSYTGNTGFLAGITDLEYKESRNSYISLNAAGVLCLERDLDVGFLVKNAVTTHILNTEKREVLRRRMADFLTTSIAYYLKNYQNDVNSNAKRDEVKAAILTFDALLVADKILPGAQEVKSGAPLLVDTESLNTDAVVASGQFRILYKRRIYSSMRFIVLQAEIGTSVVVTEV